MSAAAELKRLLNEKEIIVMPCCHDAFSARLIALSGFQASFVSGFAMAASHGLPDTGLLSFGEVLHAARFIREALPSNFPLICDGDTGYGNAMNVKRTVKAFANAGFAAIMLEDQVFPKQCGHTQGKQVVSREEAVSKIRAACDARKESGEDILILARTDARGPLGLEEAIQRCNAFLQAGADMTFLEAPLSEEEMIEYCSRVPGPKMANMLVKGDTPSLSPRRLQEIGFSFVAYPLDILATMVEAISAKLEQLKDVDHVCPQPSSDIVQQVWTIAGFSQYQQEEKLYGCSTAKADAGAKKE